jgi:hypothetical protein
MKIMYSILTAMMMAAALGQTASTQALAIDMELPSHGALVHANVYESVYVGVGGDRSRFVAELFTIVARPADLAKAGLQDLFTRGTPVAKLYALIGAQMIGDSTGIKNYYMGLTEIRETEVEALDGCDVYRTTIAEIVLELRKPMSRASFRDAYKEWQAEQSAR